MPLSLINPSKVVAGHSLWLPRTCNRWFGPANISRKRLHSSPASQEDHCAAKMSPKHFITAVNQDLSNTFSVFALLGWHSEVPIICKNRSLMLNMAMPGPIMHHLGKYLLFLWCWILADPI